MNKEELVERVKELSECTDLSNKIKEIADLKKQWKRTLSEEESFYDKEMEDKFNFYYDKIAKAEKSLAENAQEKKTSIIEKAKKLVDTKDFKNATKAMNDLFEEFKNAGRCSKELDDEFWTNFKSIKDEFYEKKNAYYQELTEKFAANKSSKEALIEKVHAVLDEEDIRSASKMMEEMMAEWKAIGSAGKDNEEELWSKFNEVRQAFYKKKNEHNEYMKGVYADRATKKEELIARAKHNLAVSSFSKEEAEEMKNIRQEWKTIGFAGKENEDSLWNTFSTIVNKYFENKKYYD